MNCNKLQKNTSFDNTKNSKCIDNKVDLLLKEIFNKRYLFRYINTKEDEDNTLRYNYLFSQNLMLEKENYYFKMFKNGKPDSVKLLYIKDSTIKSFDANKLVLNFILINPDTTNIKIKTTYSTSKDIGLNWATYNYQFDSWKCNWYLKDSTFNQY